MATKTIHSMAYRLLVDDTDFRKGMKLSQSEFGKLKREMTSTLTPLEKMQVELQQLEKIVQKDARAQEVYNRKLAQYEALLGKSNKHIDKAATGSRMLGVAWGGIQGHLSMLAGGFGLAALTHRVKEQFVEVDKLAKASRKFGVEIAFLQKIQYAASLTTSASTEQVGKAIRDLQKNTGAAIRGQKEMAAAFEIVGISANDLASLQPDELFLRVADAVGKVDNQASRLELAQKIFGEGGSELLPLFEQGSDAIKKMSDEFESFGGVVDKVAAEKIEKANDAINRLNRTISARFSQLATQAAGPVAGLAEGWQSVVTGEVVKNAMSLPDLQRQRNAAWQESIKARGGLSVPQLELLNRYQFYKSRYIGDSGVTVSDEERSKILSGKSFEDQAAIGNQMLAELRKLVGIAEEDKFTADRRTRVE